MSWAPKILQVQILVELPEPEAQALMAEIRDHGARDIHDRHRDHGLVMVPSEAITEAVLSGLGPVLSTCCSHHPVMEVYTR